MVQLSLTRLNTFSGGSPISHADPCQLGTKTACRGVPVSRKIPPGVICTVDNAWQDILPNYKPARMSTPNPWFPGTSHSFLDIILSGSEGGTAQNFIMCLLEGLHSGSRFWDVPPVWVDLCLPGSVLYRSINAGADLIVSWTYFSARAAARTSLRLVLPKKSSVGRWDPQKKLVHQWIPQRGKTFGSWYLEAKKYLLGKWAGQPLIVRTSLLGARSFKRLYQAGLKNNEQAARCRADETARCIADKCDKTLKAKSESNTHSHRRPTSANIHACFIFIHPLPLWDLTTIYMD